MAILISGIGRSGTTTLYQILGKGLIAQYQGARCVYEPYLWNIPEIESTAFVNEQPFNVGQVGLFNVYVHCNTPLFLSGRHMLHDAWLRRVFDSPGLNSKKAPDAVLAKVIRGAGRLEAALTRFNNLKVVVITRNVVDTVNSGLGIFSFFGDEFHPSDKSRFVIEVNQKFNAGIDPKKIQNEMQWSVLWWHYLTEASVRTYKKYPDRVMLVPYEQYVTAKLDVMGNIFDFCGINREFIDTNQFEESAGPQTSVSYLSQKDIDWMGNEVDWYCNRLKSVGVADIDPRQFHSDLLRIYSKRKTVTSLLMTEPTDLTAVHWRIKQNRLIAAAAVQKRTEPQPTKTIRPLSIGFATAEFGSNEQEILRLRKARKSVAGGPKATRTIGVLITCYNNAATISEAIYSVLCQSRRPDLILVADDCSTDDSVEIVRSIAARHKIVNLMTRPENIGVAANRDLAIRSMDTDYITTLDGDDLFLQGKLELEYHALGGALDLVAFSDIAMVTPETCLIQETKGYDGKGKDQILKLLTSRAIPVPRDMLFPRGLFEQANGFDVAMEIYEDWAFKMRLVAAARDGGWVHSGGIGTVYDRRNPGLSNQPPIILAYGQLLALARNADIIADRPDVIPGALRNVVQPLGDKMKSRVEAFILNLGSARNDQDEIRARLKQVWEMASLGDDPKPKFDALYKFTEVR